MYARPKEDDIVEGNERFVLSLKRISNRMVSYVKSKLVEVIDDDSKCHKSYKGGVLISYKGSVIISYKGSVIISYKGGVII